jgi:hypothetical protein
MKPPLFKSEEEAINWVYLNIPFVVLPKKKAKTMLVCAFSSVNAHSVVVENLGRELFKYQQESINNNQ